MAGLWRRPFRSASGQGFLQEKLPPAVFRRMVRPVVFMASFSSDMFTFDLRVRPTTFLFTAAAILIVGLLSQYPALKAVGRLDLGRIVRDRSF